MILQLLRQLNNLGCSKTITCSASFCFGLSLRFPCPLPKRISSRILSKSMFIPQSHPKSQQRVRTCAVKEKPVFRALLALSMLEIELNQISLPYDRGRSGYEIMMHVYSGCSPKHKLICKCSNYSFLFVYSPHLGYLFPPFLAKSLTCFSTGRLSTAACSIQNSFSSTRSSWRYCWRGEWGKALWYFTAPLPQYHQLHSLREAKNFSVLLNNKNSLHVISTEVQLRSTFLRIFFICCAFSHRS